MNTRLRLAWNVLRGRSTLAYWEGTITLGAPLELSNHAMVVGNTIVRSPGDEPAIHADLSVINASVIDNAILQPTRR